jgi:hypothetical protein
MLGMWHRCIYNDNNINKDINIISIRLVRSRSPEGDPELWDEPAMTSGLPCGLR